MGRSMATLGWGLLVAALLTLSLCQVGATKIKVYLGDKTCSGTPKQEAEGEANKCFTIEFPSPFQPNATMKAAGFINCSLASACSPWSGKVWLGDECKKDGSGALVSGGGKDASACFTQNVFGYDVSLRASCGADFTCATVVPTGAPTKAPTKAPTEAPTSAPSKAPTQAPTKAPTADPTPAPTTMDCTTDEHCEECTGMGVCVKCFSPYVLLAGVCSQPPKETSAPTSAPVTARPTSKPVPVHGNPTEPPQPVHTKQPATHKPTHAPVHTHAPHTHAPVQHAATPAPQQPKHAAPLDEFGCTSTHKTHWCPCSVAAECASGQCTNHECSLPHKHEPAADHHTHAQLCALLKEYGTTSGVLAKYGC